MRPWLAVVAGLVIGAALLGGLQVIARHADHVEAVRLLRGAGLSHAWAPMSGEIALAVFADGTWRVTRAEVDQAGGLARLTIQSGPGRAVLLDDGRRMWQLDAARKTATAMGPSEGGMDWGRLWRGYTVALARPQTVAGHRCQGVMLVSRRTGKPVLAAWIDPSTSLVTRRLTHDADGHLVAVTELIRFQPRARATREELAIPTDWRRLDALESDAKPISAAAFRAQAGYEPRPPARLPAGYSEAGLYVRACPRGCPYAELRYSDGLRVLSVYEHRPCGRGQGRGRGQGYGRGRGGGCGMGPPDRQPVLIDRGQAKTVRQRRAELVVVVTGDLTEREIRDVVESIP